MDLTFNASAILLALASATLAAVAGSGLGDPVRRPARGLGRPIVYGALAVAAFVAAALLFGPQRLPDPAWSGGLVAVAAVILLLRPGLVGLSAIAGGALAGSWSGILELQGLPGPTAWVLAAAVLVVPLLLAVRDPAFAPRPLVEEALLGVGALAVLVAAAPAVAAGWRAALALNAERVIPGLAVPLWLMLLGGGSLVLGGCYSLWKRG